MPSSSFSVADTPPAGASFEETLSNVAAVELRAGDTVEYDVLRMSSVRSGEGQLAVVPPKVATTVSVVVPGAKGSALSAGGEVSVVAAVKDEAGTVSHQLREASLWLSQPTGINGFRATSEPARTHSSSSLSSETDEPPPPARAANDAARPSRRPPEPPPTPPPARAAARPSSCAAGPPSPHATAPPRPGATAQPCHRAAAPPRLRAAAQAARHRSSAPPPSEARHPRPERRTRGRQRPQLVPERRHPPERRL
eukprot:XP_020395669.1 vegetative cell wall protein gp1-like [Zea mays]